MSCSHVELEAPPGPPSPAPSRVEDEASLVRAIASGDRAALARLYDLYSSLLFALGIRILRDRREAEDLLHDVFLEIWRSAADYDPDRGKVRTWLLIRMRCRAQDRLRSARVSRRVGGDEAAYQQVSRDDPSQGPDQQLIRLALTELPAEQRAVIELAYYEGLSSSERRARVDADRHRQVANRGRPCHVEVRAGRPAASLRMT